MINRLVPHVVLADRLELENVEKDLVKDSRLRRVSTGSENMPIILSYLLILGCPQISFFLRLRMYIHRPPFVFV